MRSQSLSKSSEGLFDMRALSFLQYNDFHNIERCSQFGCQLCGCGSRVHFFNKIAKQWRKSLKCRSGFIVRWEFCQPKKKQERRCCLFKKMLPLTSWAEILVIIHPQDCARNLPANDELVLYNYLEKSVLMAFLAMCLSEYWERLETMSLRGVPNNSQTGLLVTRLDHELLWLRHYVGHFIVLPKFDKIGEKRP